jgi:protein involved in polysaccharide export with SLBB domain
MLGMMARWVGIEFVWAMLALAGGCAANPVTIPQDLSGGSAGVKTKDMPVAAGDKVRVTVFGEDKLSGDYEIDPSGYLSLPLAGTLQVAGLTKPELETAIATKLLGEVQKPGEYQYRSGLNVLSAIAVAGGTTYRANISNVLIQRSGTTQFAEFPQSPNVPVWPGDVIRVPERYF